MKKRENIMGNNSNSQNTPQKRMRKMRGKYYNNDDKQKLWHSIP